MSDGMDFKEEVKEERDGLAQDRNNCVSGINQLITGAIPLKNKLKIKTDEELNALYPKKGGKAILVRDFLINPEKGGALNTLLTEYQELIA